MVEERVGPTGPAVPVPGMVLFDMVEERVGPTGPAVPVPGIVLFDMVEERVGPTGPAVPVPGMVLFIERVRLVGAKVELPVPVIMEEVMLPLVVDERLG
ncbi:hypothetical protein KC332_g16973 [Hortaea werneckii]|nr:hypothetical protein KC358_g17149 [Hortaea werneckii]KAI6795718.1 hypothetical protein KC350_g16973 [Hortaea werneckii]KAI6899608.1 hypothetical protein KC348_g17096 [Hortaea werneckii]KAI6919745.1 hypothetical protein KC341_g17066 [Hortaea werneckii]KAI6953265.1 hypothetical protein KC321_g17069 [Hortaea werneckii]